MSIRRTKAAQTLWRATLVGLIVFIFGCGQSTVTSLPPIYSPKVYLTDTFNNRIVRLDDISGNYLYWNTLSGFSNPKGICRYSVTGQIFISDTGNNRVVRVNGITAKYWTVFATSGTNQFSSPSGISPDSYGNVYISDTGNNRIVEIDPDGNWSLFGTSSGGNGTNQFSLPSGIFIDSANRIYVSDTGNNRIVRSDDMVGTNWISFNNDGFLSPQGVASDANGNIYVSDTGNNRIVQIGPAGNILATFGTFGSGNNQFNGPEGIYVDSAFNIYVTDTGNNRIVRISDMTGTNWVALGQYGNETNQFNQPTFAVFQ